jgi:hypothetical protein
MQTAAAAGKAPQLLAVVYPTDRTTYAQAVTMVMAFMPMEYMGKPEGEALQKELDAFFDKHKLKPPFAREADDLFKGIDLKQYLTDAMVFLKAHAKKGADPTEVVPVPPGKPTDVKMNGDSATATLSGKEVNFSKISNRWFIRLQ